VSLPHLLLVDDSEAVLAFERAALSGHYVVTTAANGREALAKVAAVRPAAMLLDLSMPEMDGDEVLAQMQRDADLRRIPVIIVSTEKQRAEACVKNGARAYLPKPIRAQDLLPLVGRVLEDELRATQQGSLSVLFVSTADVELGLPLDAVVSVLHQAAKLLDEEVAAHLLPDDVPQFELGDVGSDCECSRKLHQVKLVCDDQHSIDGPSDDSRDDQDSDRAGDHLAFGAELRAAESQNRVEDGIGKISSNQREPGA